MEGTVEMGVGIVRALACVVRALERRTAGMSRTVLDELETELEDPGLGPASEAAIDSLKTLIQRDLDADHRD